MKVKIYYLTDETGIPRYVGKTTRTLKRRLNGHKAEARKSTKNHRLKWLLKHIDNIKIHLIEECNEEVWKEREIFWIAEYRRIYSNLTNTTDGGDGVSGFIFSNELRKKLSDSHKGQRPWMQGKHHTEETKNKISEAKKGTPSCMQGKHHTEETKKKLSESATGNTHWLGKSHSEETKKKLSEIHTGRKQSEETIRKKRGKIPWNKGITMSEETKNKISEAKKGTPSWKKGKITPDDVRKKISNTLTGRKLSDERKQAQKDGRIRAKQNHSPNGR